MLSYSPDIETATGMEIHRNEKLQRCVEWRVNECNEAVAKKDLLCHRSNKTAANEVFQNKMREILKWLCKSYEHVHRQVQNFKLAISYCKKTVICYRRNKRDLCNRETSSINYWTCNCNESRMSQPRVQPQKFPNKKDIPLLTRTELDKVIQRLKKQKCRFRWRPCSTAGAEIVERCQVCAASV